MSSNGLEADPDVSLNHARYLYANIADGNVHWTLTACGADAETTDYTTRGTFYIIKSGV